jgi:hypothetical protein
MIAWYVKIDEIGLQEKADLNEKCFLNRTYEEPVCFNFMLSYKNVTYLTTDDKQIIYTDVNTVISTYMK